MEEVFLICPYCAEEVSMLVDLSPGTHEYVEDCEVCCNPISVKAQISIEGIESFQGEPLGQ